MIHTWSGWTLNLDYLTRRDHSLFTQVLTTAKRFLMEDYGRLNPIDKACVMALVMAVLTIVGFFGTFVVAMVVAGHAKIIYGFCCFIIAVVMVIRGIMVLEKIW